MYELWQQKAQQHIESMSSQQLEQQLHAENSKQSHDAESSNSNSNSNSNELFSAPNHHPSVKSNVFVPHSSASSIDSCNFENPSKSPSRVQLVTEESSYDAEDADEDLEFYDCISLQFNTNIISNNQQLTIKNNMVINCNLFSFLFIP